MHGRIAISSSAARRFWREGRHAARRELALKLRREGKTLAAIGAVLSVSTARAFQMVRKAERIENEPSGVLRLPAGLQFKRTTLWIEPPPASKS